MLLLLDFYKIFWKYGEGAICKIRHRDILLNMVSLLLGNHRDAQRLFEKAGAF